MIEKYKSLAYRLMKQSQFGQSGQTIVITVIVLTVILITVFVVASGSLDYFHNAQFSVQDMQATNLAEAGIDKAVASLNATAGSYNGESETFLGAGSFSTSVVPLNASTYLIKSTGYIPNKSKSIDQKTIQIQVTKGTGVSFNYGMQVGNGGISMGNGSTINGSIYSNGNITAGNGSVITGDMFVAGGGAPVADQKSDCTNPNCTDYFFGETVSGENRQDVAQSFTLSTSNTLNKVSIKLKKYGSPSNPTVKILGDTNGAPNKNNVIATGTLLASTVPSNAPSYNFIDVTFTSTPTLSANTPYWLMIVTPSLNSSNYWSWSDDTLQGYTRGSPAWSVNWQANSPVWTPILGDLGFQVYLGGVATYANLSNGTVKGNAHANTLQNMTVNGNAYYQTASNITVKGTSYPGSADPPPQVMPVSAANISAWQSQAAAAGTTIGDVSGCPSTLGPGKWVGNITINNGCVVTVKTPIWFTGNMNVGNSVVFKLDPSYGDSSGVILIDGTITIGNGITLSGSGTSGSSLMLLTTYNSTTTNAISLGNGSATGILCAPYGIVNLPNGASFQEITAYQIILGNNSVLNYQSGMASLNFSSGPSGSFSVIKGTYQTK